MRRLANLPAIWLVLCLALAAPTLAAENEVVPGGTAAERSLDARLATWEATAKRAEEAIRSAGASDAAFGILRAELADQRSQAFAIIQRGDISADVIRAQIEALGPAPGKDASEPEAIALRRTTLEARLAQADAPVRAAREAYNRADLLISEIDGLLRARFSAALLERSPTPLLPTRWLPALAQGGQLVSELAHEIRDSLAAEHQRGRLGAILLQAAGLAAGGLAVLLVIGPLLMRRFDRRIAVTSGWRNGVLVPLALVLRLVVPAVGAGLLVAAVLALRLDVRILRDLPTLVMAIAAIMVCARWIADLVFAPGAPQRRSISLDESAARSGGHLSLALGVILSLEAVLEMAARDSNVDPATESVFSGLVVIAGAYVLWQIAAILLRADAPASVGGDGREKRIDFLSLLARLVHLSAGAAVIAVVIGYVRFARQALDPMILTLAAISLSIACYRGLNFMARLVFGREGRVNAAILAMVPLLIGVVLALTMLPVLALVWGAQPTDLGELWVLLVQGVVIGNTRISIGALFILLAVLLLGLAATRWIQRLLGQAVLPRTRLDRGGQNAILTGLGYAGVTLSALLAISMAGIDLSNLAIVAGALSVGIGFGLQAIVSNFVSGIILLVERPIKEGDWIEVSGQSGIVRKIAVRATRIETFDRHDVIVPNSDLIAGTVKNMTLSSRSGRLILPIGVAYGSDLETTRRIILDAAKRHAIVLEDPAPILLFTGLGESSLDFELRCFLQDISSGLSTKSDLLFEIYRELSAAGIEIPFPQRDLNLRNIDELAKAVAAVIEAGRRKDTVPPAAGDPTS